MNKYCERPDAIYDYHYTGGFNGCSSTARTTLSKKYVCILPWNFAFIWNYQVCLSVLKLAPDKHATNAFNTK